MIRKINCGKLIFVFLQSLLCRRGDVFVGRPLGKYTSVRYILLFFSAVCFYTHSLWASAPAERDDDLSASAWYLGARAGYVYKYNACADIAIECDRDDAGYGIFAGYKTARNLAVEFSANDLGEATGFYPNITLDGEIRTADLSLLYTGNIYKNINAFGKVGFAYWDGKVTGWDEELTDSGVRPLLGAGIQFPLLTNIDGRVEYQYLDQLGNHWMGYTDAHFLSFSILWKFPSAKKSTTATPRYPAPQESHVIARP